MAKQERTAREARLLLAATELRILVGSVVEALGFYDSDDGHNDIVLAGIASEFNRIEDTYEDVLLSAAGRKRRAKERD